MEETFCRASAVVMGEKSDRERLMQYLHTHKGRLRSAYRVDRIAVIGSFARDNYRANSDIDLLVRFEPDTENIYDRKRSLAVELEDEFGRPVQIAYITLQQTRLPSPMSQHR